MFQLNHHSTLVNKHRQKDGKGHLPFSNEKLLLLLLALAHLENLIFKLRTAILLLEAIIEQTYKATNKNH